ncbi:MAG: hypothetical protein M0Q88_00395 [Bacilli bacterium]|nr:hypothetical protein [Bacilli bacterium]
MDIQSKLLKLNIFENNEFFQKYVYLLETNRDTEKIKFKTASHHIIPKSFCKKLGIKVDNSKSGVINLSHRDHALAHYYIAMCTKDDYLRYSSISAIQHIIGFNKKMNQENIDQFIENLDSYQALKEEQFAYHSSITKGKLVGDLNPAKRPEVREKIRLSKLGNTNNKGKKIHDEKWCAAISANRLGKIAVTNKDTLEQKFISESELNNYINNGWYKGTKLKGTHRSEEARLKNGLAHKGRIRITDGINNKSIYEKDLQRWLEIGYYKGMTKKYIRSQETIQKVSAANKGRIALHKPGENKTRYIHKEDNDLFAKLLEEGYIIGGAPKTKKEK